MVAALRKSSCRGRRTSAAVLRRPLACAGKVHLARQPVPWQEQLQKLQQVQYQQQQQQQLHKQEQPLQHLLHSQHLQQLQQCHAPSTSSSAPAPAVTAEPCTAPAAVTVGPVSVGARWALAGLVAVVEGRAAAAAAPAEGDLAAAPRRADTGFRSRCAPEVGLDAYARRLQADFRCSAECYVICAAYLDRLEDRHPGILNPLSCHRLLLCSLMLATKFQDDHHYVNAVYAEIGGLSLQEMNALETRMLVLLDYRLCVAPGAFERYRDLCCNAPSGAHRTHQLACRLTPASATEASTIRRTKN